MDTTKTASKGTHGKTAVIVGVLFIRVLNPQGHHVVTGGTMRQIIEVGLRSAQMRSAQMRGAQMSAAGGQTFSILEHPVSADNLVTLKELIEAYKVKPATDRCYPLEAAADALRYYGKRRTRGKVVITMERRSV